LNAKSRGKPCGFMAHELNTRYKGLCPDKSLNEATGMLFKITQNFSLI